MGHPFKSGVGIIGVCIHRYVNETDGYSYICGMGKHAEVHSVNDLEVPGRGYADGTSGHSGTETSEARVRRDDASGTTAERQAQVVTYLSAYNLKGITVRELRNATGWHHGQASAALTNLHKAGKIVRLAEVRDACKVYVLPEWAGDRETEAYASRSPKPEPLTTDERDLIEELLTAYRDLRVRWELENLADQIARAESALAKIKAGAQ